MNEVDKGELIKRVVFSVREVAREDFKAANTDRFVASKLEGIK